MKFPRIGGAPHPPLLRGVIPHLQHQAKRPRPKPPGRNTAVRPLLNGKLSLTVDRCCLLATSEGWHHLFHSRYVVETPFNAMAKCCNDYPLTKYLTAVYA